VNHITAIFCPWKLFSRARSSIASFRIFAPNRFAAGAFRVYLRAVEIKRQ
jgi:hypothetical protein